MTEIHSIPRVASDADVGLICGFILSAAHPPRDLEADDIDAALSVPDSVTWLHFNLSDARARHLLANAAFVPDDLKEVFRDYDLHRRVEALEAGLLVVISDLTFEVGDAAEVGPLWCYVSSKLLLTARTHPLRTMDQLRAAARAGLRADGAIELLTWLLGRRTAALRRLAGEMSEQVEEIEDEILAGNIKAQREQLGRIRRSSARLRRHFGPDRSAFLKLLQRRPGLLSESDTDAIRAEIDELSFLIDDVTELYERAKLLQEELASRVAEDTGRSLYVLAILSAVLLPMTLITGIFGMNVAGLPGLHGTGAFWWVLLLIIVAGTVTLATIFSRQRS